MIAVSPPGWETPELEPVEYLPSALVRRLLGLFDELEPLSFVGFSWGATIGCHLAAHAPERLDALVLLDAGYTDFQDRPGYEELDLEGVTASSREQAREARWTTWEECFAFFRPFVRKWRPAVEERLRGAMREENGVIVPIVRPEVFAAAAYGVMAEPPSKTLEELGRLVLPILLQRKVHVEVVVLPGLRADECVDAPSAVQENGDVGGFEHVEHLDDVGRAHHRSQRSVA